MSRLQNARVRALKATAGDLEEIAAISGLTRQERFHLHEARRICLALMEKPVGHQVERGDAPASKPAADGPCAPGAVSDERRPAIESAQKRDDEVAAAVRRDFPNHGRPWDGEHIAHLRSAVQRPQTVELDITALSKLFGRSPYSIALKAVSMGHRDKDWADRHRINPANGPAGHGADVTAPGKGQGGLS